MTRPIGDMNVSFTKNYLAREGMEPVAEDVGGTFPRRIEFSPKTGVVRVKRVDDIAEAAIRSMEERLARGADRKKPARGVELF